MLLTCVLRRQKGRLGLSRRFIVHKKPVTVSKKWWERTERIRYFGEDEWCDNSNGDGDRWGNVLCNRRLEDGV